MKTERTKLITTTALAFIYNILFWNQSLGLNAPIFCLIFIAAMYFIHKENFRGLNLWIVLTGGVCTSILVVIHNSQLSKVIHILSMILLTGNIHYSQIRNLLFTFLTAISGLITLPKQLIKSWAVFKDNSTGMKQVSKAFKLVFAPILVLTIFYWIFIFANPKFNELCEAFWSVVYDYIGFIIQDISFLRALTFGITFLIIGATVFKSTILYFFNWDQQSNDQLLRSRNSQKKSFAHILSLKSEYKTAALMVGMVNGLLLIVNSIDIQWIWFNFDPASIKNLSQFVHEGTYLLIGSILLSIGIILYFFRSNLNFYTSNKSLKTLSYVWIIQNVILCISVTLRNYHYIDSFGLAYKRIGVIIFLMITIIGLATLFIKIKKTYSGYYLWRVNAWSVYLVLFFACFVNWDIFIATYNLKVHTKKVDLEFLLTLSNKTLPILYSHKALFEEYKDTNANRINDSTYSYTTTAQLDNKVSLFYAAFEHKDWPSWNYADAKAFTEMKKLKP